MDEGGIVMAGIPHGIVDIRGTGSAVTSVQEVFKSWYEAMEVLQGHGYVNRIALQYGSGGAGTDFHDEANPFETNAFFVYEWPSNDRRPWSWYLMVQYGTGDYGAAPGDPCRFLGTAAPVPGDGSIGVAVAIAFDSSDNPASPWTGSTNFDGADRKGAVAGTGPVWAAPGGGTIFTFPRSNDVGGAHATDKENTLLIFNTNAAASRRLHVIGDEDNLWVVTEFDDDNNAGWLYCGSYTPLATTGADAMAPFCVLKLVSTGATGGSDVAQDVLFGPTAGTGLPQGGVVSPDNAQVYGVRLLHGREYGPISGADPDENIRPTDPGRIALPVPLWVDEAGVNGLVGWTPVDQFGFVGNDQRDVRPTTGPPFTHAAFGTSFTTDARRLMRWGADTEPKATSTRTGTVI